MCEEHQRFIPGERKKNDMKNSTAGNSSLKSNPERDENNSPITTGVLLNDDGGLLYEGFLYKGKPCLLGKLFYPDGGIYQEGIFFYKGLIFGKEYYPDGKLRFEGVYEMNYACGPNYPISGRWLSNSGDEEYQGTLKITKSSIGYHCLSALLKCMIRSISRYLQMTV
jgi:hypothetical protein